MTATDAVGGMIDRLMERRYGAPFSEKWWARRHAALHPMGLVELACAALEAHKGADKGAPPTNKEESERE